MALLDTTLPIGYATSLTPNAGKALQSAEDGSTVVINKYDTVVYSGTIVLPFCTAAQLVTILAFYETNKNLIFTFEHPGDSYTYSLYFTNAPNHQRNETLGDVRHTVTLEVVGTRG